MKVSAQTRERTLRMAVVPFSRRPTLHWSVQHFALEQDYEERERKESRCLIISS